MQFVQAMPFEEAVDKLGDRTPIGSELLSSEWSDVPLALRERAFFSSEVESVRFLQRARDAVSDFLTSDLETLESGDTALATASRAQFVELMREFALKEGMGPLDEATTGGLRDITSERRLSLIFNTQVQQANDYGYWKQGMNPDVLDEFPAQRFIRVKEVKKEREAHIPYEGQVFLKTDPIWTIINQDFGVPWGPWGWGCGHDVEDVDRSEAEELGLVKPGQEVEPDTRNFNENLRASASTIDPDLLAKLKEEFGDQLVIEGDEMRWRGPNDAKAQTAKEPAAPAAVPGPEPEPEPAAAQRINPVSAALELKVAGGLRESVGTALAAIDQVHDDGDLPQIPVVSTREKLFGAFAQKIAGGMLTADRIKVKSIGPWPALTAVHEIGHFLDLEAIGPKGRFATRASDPDIMKVIEAARKTEAIKLLEQKRALSGSSRLLHYLDYLLSPVEIWARAYSQFITERSGNRTLMAELAKALEAEKGRQWTTEDFKPVARALEALLRKLGWM